MVIVQTDKGRESGLNTGSRLGKIFWRNMKNKEEQKIFLVDIISLRTNLMAGRRG